MYMIPDKAQHYYGSYLLSSVSQKYLGDVVGPLTTFAVGFLWEVKDNKSKLNGHPGILIGFSTRDLIADGLGVLSSIVNKGSKVKMWLDYSRIDKEIMFNVSMKI